MVKYALMAFIQWTVSSVLPERSTGSAAFISVVLVVVDIEVSGGGLVLTGDCSGGTVGRGIVIEGAAGGRGLVVGTTGGTVVTRGVIGG